MALRNIAPGESHSPAGLGTVLNNAVFGFTDGLITDMAVVAGIVAAPNSSTYLVVVAALAATFAGALSMFLGAYVAAHTRYRYMLRERVRELREVDEVPETERQEVREIYSEQGFTPDEVEMIVRRVTSNRELWVSTMMREELGFGEEDLHSPRVRTEAVIGLMFLVGSLIPILPFLSIQFMPGLPGYGGLTADDTAFAFSLLLSIIGLGLMGAYKERFGENKPWKGALQMLVVGLGGAGAVYLIIAVVGTLLVH